MKHRVAHVASILFVVLSLALVPVALAGKGGGGPKGGGGNTGNGSISLAPLVYDANGNGLPNYGDTVTFNISTATTKPWVNLYCYKSGLLVAQGSMGYFDGALNTSRNFRLYSPKWTGGAADCTAYLDMYTKRGWSHLASTSFHVDA